MRKIVAGVVAAAALGALGWTTAWAQVKSTHEAGVPKITTSQVTGEVVYTEGNYLLAKMQPSGHYRAFNVRSGQEFMIDGVKKTVGDLKTGTVLTATVITKEEPKTVRTTSVLDGTVWYASGDYVILTHANGENHEYNVPESFKFMGVG
jgi:hypothetical protein